MAGGPTQLGEGTIQLTKGHTKLQHNMPSSPVLLRKGKHWLLPRGHRLSTYLLTSNNQTLNKLTWTEQTQNTDRQTQTDKQKKIEDPLENRVGTFWYTYSKNWPFM